MDLDRFRADVADRVRAVVDRAARPRLPVDADAQAAIQAAIALATERRRETVQGLHLLYALTRAGHGTAADLLARYGGNAAILNQELERAM